MTKLGFAAFISASVGLAALWYISRNKIANKQTSKSDNNSTDVDMGLPGKSASIPKGKFSASQPERVASGEPKKNTKEELVQLHLKTNPVTVKEARELRETVSPPPLTEFLENFNIVNDNDNDDDNCQDEIPLQQKAAIEEAPAACNQ